VVEWGTKKRLKRKRHGEKVLLMDYSKRITPIPTSANREKRSGNLVERLVNTPDHNEKGTGRQNGRRTNETRKVLNYCERS